MNDAQSLRILLVDDQPQVQEMLAESLERIGLGCSIDMRIPRESAKRFGCELPSGEELEEFDLAVIDLELFTKFGSPLSYSPDDLRGGTEVLPYLRSEAPWLPVIALSSHFTSEIHDFLVAAGGFGFDGSLPKILLSANRRDERRLKRSTWDNMISMAKRLRSLAAIGEGAFGWAVDGAALLQLEVSPAAREALDREFGSWEGVVRELFFFAEKVTLKSVGGGFSGARTFRAFVRLGSTAARLEGEWLIKLGRPRKLHVEAQAHLRMVRSGIDAARVVPLLWRSVLVHESVAGLAYQFARGTTEAGEYMRLRGVPDLAGRVAELLQDFYGERITERSLVRTILEDNFGPDEYLKILLGRLSNVSDEGRTSVLESVVRYRKSLIHGDLHLGNIMLGDKSVLIDFARSRVGPVALDGAKLVSDMLLGEERLRDGFLPFWSVSEAAINKETGPLRRVFDFNEDEIKVYNVALLLFLARSQEYEDASGEAKAWVASILARVELSDFWG